MAYEKQTWQSGDIITAEKLNHMEDGIDGAGFNESNLPIAESLGSGDKLRIVTSDGASKQIGADSVGAVEVVKLGTLHGGGSGVGDSTKVYVGSGGGSFADTLESLTHGKQIIGVVGEDADTYNGRVFALNLMVNDGNGDCNVLTNWEIAKGYTNVSYFSLSSYLVSTLDVYAICI